MYSYITLLVVFLATLTDCNPSTNGSTDKRVNPEGYIQFTVKLYADIDDTGVPIHPVAEHHLLSVNRKMYIHGDYLIDIRETERFVDGRYKGLDTTSYNFYDLTRQKFISFDRLSDDARILQTGKTTEFTNVPKLDPMNEVSDSTWKVTDMIIKGKTVGVVSFIYRDTTDTLAIGLIKRNKFLVDYSIKNFPIQLSYKLSRKLQDGFIYKMEQPGPDGKSVLVTTLTYEPAKLQDTLVRIFNKWAPMIRQ